MPPDEFGALRIFVAVAERRSFVQAARYLGLSTSTVSQRVRALEEQLGVRLLNRTTRSVGLTEAGDLYRQRIEPALMAIDEAAEEVCRFRDRPAGTLRLSVSSLGLAVVVAPALPDFLKAYPDIRVELSVDDAEADLLDGRIDAGVRRQDAIPQDMIAVRVTPESRFVCVASPDYLERQGEPQAPADLSRHNCIRFHYTTGQVHAWEFQDRTTRLSMPTSGSLVTDRPEMILQAAAEGVGIGHVIEAFAADLIRDGRLKLVLEDYAAPFAGWFLYYPGRRQAPLPLKLFSEFLLRRQAGAAAARRLAETPEQRLAAG